VIFYSRKKRGKTSHKEPVWQVNTTPTLGIALGRGVREVSEKGKPNNLKAWGNKEE